MSGLPQSMHDFSCLHVTAAELASPNRLRSAAGSLPLDAPTLLVMEAGATPRVDGGNYSSWMHAPLPPAVSKVFTTPLQVGTFYPIWDRVEVDDAAKGRTLAYDLIQQLVCSASRRIHGNAGSEFVHGICRWRDAALFKKLVSSQPSSSDDICSTLWEA